MGDDSIDLTTPTKGLNDPVDTLEEWVPKCDEEIKPVVGKVFDTLEQGGDFYQRYAHTAGFSVRKATETKDKNGETKWKYFLCSKEGFKLETKEGLTELLVDDKKLPKTRRRKLTREGCNARIVFKRTQEGKYEVVRFHE
ncbi:FAR1 DNA-binding domain, partial [Sesbania bispinosa]